MSIPHLSYLHTHGFVLVKSLLSHEEVEELHSACQTSTTRARAGDWPYIRTLPKQFPPWPSKPGPEGIWGVQHLLHPDQPGRDIYARSYFHPRLLEVVEEILGVRRDIASLDSRNAVETSNGTSLPNDAARENGMNGTNGSDGVSHDEPLVMELYNLLVRPDCPFQLRWHRDDIPPTDSASEEESALGIAHGSTKTSTYTHTQWNLALEPDESLLVVPGTHARARTQAERDAGPHDVLEGQVAVRLEPGDVVFYDNDILHRGVYSADKERYTLHGSVGKVGSQDKRARNVLQHGVGSWISECSLEGLDAGMKLTAERMKTNLMRMGSGSVGYSQCD